MQKFIQTHRHLILLLIAIVIAALPTILYPLGRDQGEFSTIGRGILDGRVPYVDLWNPKPPAVFYVYAGAMALLGRTAAALRAIDLIIIPIIAATLYAIGTRIANRRVGLWAALLLAVFYFTETFWTLTQNDGIALLPMTLAFWAMLRTTDTHRRHTWLWALISGALCGWTLWFKYPFVFFVLALVIAYAIQTRTAAITRRQHAYHLSAFALGGLLTGGGGILALASQNALDDLLISATVTSQYTALGFNFADFTSTMFIYFGFRVQQWGILWLLVIAWLPLMWKMPILRTRGWLVIAVWLGGASAAMLIQAKGYDYHWLPMLAPLALFAASTCDTLFMMAVRRRHKNAARVVRIGAVLGLFALLIGQVWTRTLPYVMGQQSERAYLDQFVAGDFYAWETAETVALLRERVVEGDSLFIWGFRPEIYYLSGLNPAVRFIFHFPLVGAWYPPEWKEETVEILWAALPPYVLVTQVDYMEWVTGRDADSNTLLQEYTALNNWLVYNYELDTQIGNIFIWRRKP